MKSCFIGLIVFTAWAGYSPADTNTTGNAVFSNPDKPVRVEAGRAFTIRMESNPTTGYGWQLAKALDDKIVLTTNVFLPPESRLCGAGGHEAWTFSAVATGQTSIAMQYIRPWETNRPAATNAFTVIIE